MLLFFEELSRHICSSHEPDSIASIGAFSRFNNPYAFLIDIFLILKEVVKSGILWPLKMIGFGDDKERIYFFHMSVVMLHGIEQCFFGANEGVMGNVIGYNVDISVIMEILCCRFFFEFVGQTVGDDELYL